MTICRRRRNNKPTSSTRRLQDSACFPRSVSPPGTTWPLGTEKIPLHWFKQCCRIVILVLACTLLPLGNVIAAQDIVGSDALDGVEQRPGDPEDSLSGYPDEQQPVVGETDAEEDLDDTFPKKDSVFDIGVPKEYFKWKEDLYEKYGLKLGVSYQLLFQYASDTAPFANFDTALGHWWGFTSKWTPLNRGKDYEGSLVLTAHERVAIGDNAVPAQFGGADLGSIWSNFEWTEWDFSVEDLYWEQWLEKDRFTLRVGNQIPTTIYNSFRFKDARTSFTASPFAFHESIPYPTYGLGGAFKWWPTEGSELYVVGTLNDMNGDPNVRGLDWSTFGRGEYFYGLEFGYNWKRESGEFDHVHLDIFYADERSTRSPDTMPNKAGGGFKLLGSKQWNRYVVFGSYTLNTAEGGGISVSFARHTVTAGAAYLTPLGIRGEAALGFMWMKPHPDFLGGNLRDQYGVETYWKILLTQNLWITPGIQVVFDPSLNPTTDVIVIPHFKFRVAF